MLDAERTQVVAGLDRYGRRQKELAREIRTDLARLRTADAPQDPQLSDKVEWETRMFEQRRQMVSYVCDVPNLIEQRLGALLRTVQDLLA
jgi:hypothetical protein